MDGSIRRDVAHDDVSQSPQAPLQLAGPGAADTDPQAGFRGGRIGEDRPGWCDDEAFPGSGTRRFLGVMQRHRKPQVEAARRGRRVGDHQVRTLRSRDASELRRAARSQCSPQYRPESTA